LANKKHSGIWRYTAVVAACFAIGWAVAQLPPVKRIDNYAYDLLSSRTQPLWTAHSVVVAIDERTFRERGGTPKIREIESEALERIAHADTLAVATDVILADPVDPVQDARLEAALRSVRTVILSSDLASEAGGGAKWEDPLPRFQALAASEPGHVTLMEDQSDGVTRQIPLERIALDGRRWSLLLQTLSVARNQPIVETPDQVEIGALIIPAPRSNSGRPLYTRYLPQGRIPVIPVLDLDRRRTDIRGRVVFLGVTALSAARDRVVTPSGESISGVEALAQGYETLLRGEFLTRAREGTLLLVCVGLAAAAGAGFQFFSGWVAYIFGASIMALAIYLPVIFFRNQVVLPSFAPAAVAWLCTAGAASYQHFFVRRQLKRAESERSRYQQAIHWAAHEMRTPLTAIQGSSEIMARYNLPDVKRAQLTDMINSESKRLARIIQTFLDVERLADGQMELKREQFSAAEIVDACLKRVTTLADRKKIAISLDNQVAGELVGDRELMEYAVYNLLTNAVKYSPAGTDIHVFSELQDGELRLSVKDQGIGMEAKELKNIFKKFYRTKRAEASGEVGTGIGLSIVEQIVTRHGGRIDVTSEAGKGSCFTLVLKAATSPAGTDASVALRRGDSGR
jgi:signal transduction histidine kinase